MVGFKAKAINKGLVVDYCLYLRILPDIVDIGAHFGNAGDLVLVALKLRVVAVIASVQAVVFFLEGCAVAFFPGTGLGVDSVVN